MRTLLLGFSVTASQFGYATRLQERFESLTVIGIGGINPLPLPGLFDSITERHGSFDFVLLEISTSVYSRLAQADDAKIILQDLTHRIQSTGAQVGFISLYRDDFDYSVQPFDPLIRSVCEAYGLPLLDLGPGLLASHGREYCRSLLRDVVHTNDHGADFQADHVAEFIRSLESVPKQAAVPVPKRRHRQLVLGTEGFSRAGLDCSYLSIPSGQSHTVDVPGTATVFGVFYITDPASGFVTFTADHSSTLLLLYELSGTPHFGYQRLNLRGCVKIEPLPDIPDVKLRKGELSPEPRTAKIAALHIFEDT